MSKIVVVKTKRPKVVAYQCKAGEHIYVPKPAAEGGGYWHGSSGNFYSASYTKKLFTMTPEIKEKYTPLLEGDQLHISHDDGTTEVIQL